MLNQYLTGLQWILRYYNGQLVSGDWYYPYNDAPLLAELIRPDTVIHNFPPSITARSVLNHLLIVLPPSFSALVPRPLSYLMHSGSPIADLYPTEVNRYIDRMYIYRNDDATPGEKYSGIPSLPPINTMRIRAGIIAYLAYIRREGVTEYVRSVYAGLTKDQQLRQEYDCSMNGDPVLRYADNIREDQYTIKIFRTIGPSVLESAILWMSYIDRNRTKYNRYTSMYERDYPRIYHYRVDRRYWENHLAQPGELSVRSTIGNYSAIKPNNPRKKKRVNPRTTGTMAQYYGSTYDITYFERLVKKAIPKRIRGKDNDQQPPRRPNRGIRAARKKYQDWSF